MANRFPAPTQREQRRTFFIEGRGGDLTAIILLCHHCRKQMPSPRKSHVNLLHHRGLKTEGITVPTLVELVIRRSQGPILHIAASSQKFVCYFLIISLLLVCPVNFVWYLSTSLRPLLTSLILLWLLRQQRLLVSKLWWMKSA